MFFSKQIITVLTTLLIGAATVQAQGQDCLTLGPGNRGFNGGRCEEPRTYCGPANPDTVICCVTCPG
ncbi:hypothetical protein HYFRA_00012640 [Hymenoscyphus fraxineus]|uniref:Uncharacterized protein n=1 Tax=Hymenoscyphus fraxineus TaxID=746836 RepID=A0A9N9L8G1_9HELO|nr:hypothetical protein HYFRA_00012640 [Hymenoscyphus fraxineus]